ncbi:hypothetical protein CXG81DRAFT_19094 [Caulochytrium protostelioides]|uniref:EKC/KEOPS complex subunit CGI121 n=1 Tax=Caulochytrium protostelioides TaxID=1555241 RepID=A0A4P9X7M5_9FUNG|nr:hypothetical protein CXG81DRAFT_19094 [Caulochytrium protostelioides]|eukprot:RKP01050.1 hypothetical protein CXG81DRAFT_19094 [Caulochytrium protostelioides]
MSVPVSTWPLPALLTPPPPERPHASVKLPAPQYMHARYYTDVTNAAAVLERVIAGASAAEPFPACALINPAVACGFPTIVASATTRALCAERSPGGRRTHSLYSEILYNLHGGRGLSAALKACGLAPGLRAVLAVIVTPDPTLDPEVLAALDRGIAGTPTPVAAVRDAVDMPTVRAIWKLDGDGEAAEIDSPEAALPYILSSMSLKGYMS